MSAMLSAEALDSAVLIGTKCYIVDRLALGLHQSVLPFPQPHRKFVIGQSL